MFTRSLRRTSLATVAGVLATAVAFPVQDVADGPRPNPVPLATRAAWSELESTWEGRLEPTFDARTGEFLDAAGKLLVAPQGIDESNLPRVAGAVARRLAPVFGVRADELVLTDAQRYGSFLRARFEHAPNGVPVLTSHLTLHFSPQGELVSLAARDLLRGVVDTAGFVSAGDAAELARIAPPDAGPDAWAWNPTRVVAVDRTSGSAVPRPAWRVLVGSPELDEGSWSVLVDARTGEVFSAAPGATGGELTGSVEGRGADVGPQEHVAGLSTLPMAWLHLHGSDFASLLVALTADVCGNSQAVISGDGTRVVYVSDCDGDQEIFTVGPDGLGLLQLTTNSADDYAPAVSDDGSVITFVSEVDGDPEIFRVFSDGSGLLQLTTNTDVDTAPSIADDASKVAYESDRDGDFEIYRSDLDGSSVEQLTTNALYDGEAALAGDGTKIAFVRGTDSSAEIWSMDADGGSALQLTFNAVRDGQPTISDDGGAVAFTSWVRSSFLAGPRIDDLAGGGSFGGRAHSMGSIWGIGSSGMGLDRLTEEAGEQLDPHLAGSGAALAYARRTKDGGDWDVVVMELASHAEVPLVMAGTDERAPCLADDGLSGVLTSDEGAGDSEVVYFDFGGPGSEKVVTDEIGGYSFTRSDGSSVSLYAKLRGEYVRVKDKHPSQGNLSVIGEGVVPGSLDLMFNPLGAHALATPQVSGYFHGNEVHDWLAEIVGTRLGKPVHFDGPLTMEVNVPGRRRNAFYNHIDKKARFLVGAGPSAPNTCFDTIVYHEYGHFVDDMYGGLVRSDPLEHPFACSEGFADAAAIFTEGTPIIGAGFYGTGTWLRNYTKKVKLKESKKKHGSMGRQYDCRDCRKKDGAPEPHDHGEALGGFVFDLREGLGVPDALGPFVTENLVMASLVDAPTSMRKAVEKVFFEAGAVGSPDFDSICLAARRHGFDCLVREDFGSHGCIPANLICGPETAKHLDTGFEMLGSEVTPDPGGCSHPDMEVEDGVTIPAGPFTSGEMVPMTFTVSTHAKLKDSGRYGGVLLDGSANELRYLYLNVWLFVDRGTFFEEFHVVGTGSGGPGTGVPGFAADTFALDPATWGPGTSKSETLMITMPGTAEPTKVIVRARLDYGEDAGELKPKNPLAHPAYMGPCGPARSGEVEDYVIDLEE